MRTAAAVLTILLTVGCVTKNEAMVQPLGSPPGAAPAAAEELRRGNGLFAAHNWSGAQAAYDAVLKMDSSIAEAHYNLGLTLEQLGNKAEARKHYVQAANLAPGNTVIWNAPPLRKFERDHELEKKSFMDASPR
jgi:Flp pilus assembly protein TadD